MFMTTADILEIARKAINIFVQRGLQCCLVGSVASYLYGVNRTPNDIDLVVLTTGHGQELLKQMLVSADANFYTVPSRTPGATYRVLWYQKGRASSSIYSHRYASRCKVDILVPGTMNIPAVPTARVRMRSGLPVMPVMPHLFLKLQAWADHRASSRLDQVAKQYTDMGDVDALLVIAVAKRVRMGAKDLGWVPASMVSAARERARSYVAVASQSSAAQWRALGVYNISTGE